MPLIKVDLHITARGELVSEAWLWRLSRDFDVRMNIVRASIEPDFGWVHVELEGAAENIQRATAWLMTTGLHVEAQQRSVGVPS